MFKSAHHGDTILWQEDGSSSLGHEAAATTITSLFNAQVIKLLESVPLTLIAL